ncbi:molybdopterin-guanine dinucleotide biosynthesis protein MobA [Rubrivivax gelatinosus]|uniref:Molybdopterin-guanine dinucleotide biosynthesis protein MobA n=1 Tax=Rubrivivax gelatinosus TaxID=28068 RepID=A0ABS1DZC3_RUBGE|nr:nucleotidyltransferase family protein [Rubrivivax gelatinosus]MBK1616360.1 molybdopterin-guanine dinucleotide biosynthesis protein MobA [Rubrivivax gelatinosus]MBK1715447.1 molybdopterin-guanine dinucleotide biosynthesis protein MobA [Rubrivivax gelatinosus]
MNTSPTIVVLAAGHGTRLQPGRPRLEQPLAGSTVLGTTVANALQTGLRVLVVTTERLVPLLLPQLTLQDLHVLAEDSARRGRGQAIAAGVGDSPQSPGWLVLPGDMPLVRPETMLAVAQAIALHAVACAQHGGRRGHPVAFAAELYSELASLQTDEGARRLLARYPAVGVPVDDAGVLVDVDTDADLDSLRLPQRRVAGG